MKPVEVVSTSPIGNPGFGERAATASSVPAFPGAEGGGAAAIGGRGGRVIEVTNLDNSGPGSLRAACEASGARIVVFRVGGTIELQEPIRISNPYITIAGQTAPGGGILISGTNLDQTPIGVYTHEVIIRFLRVRTGRGDQSGQGGDCIGLQSNCYNVIIDHCSVSWSNDENLQVWADNGASHDITFSWNIISEGLTFDHNSCGLIVGSDNNSEDMVNIDVHHNLFMHNQKRNPLVKGMSSRVINNIVYNWEWNSTMFGGGTTIDIIGNLYKAGPTTEISEMHIHHWIDEGTQGDPSIYIRGNISPGQSDPEGDNWFTMDQGDSQNFSYGHPPDRETCERSTPMTGSPFPITVHSVLDIENMILADVGASKRLDENGNWVSNRDAVDERLIQEYLSGTGIIPYDENSVGGFPTISPGTPYQDSDHDGMADEWEYLYCFNPNDPSDGPGDADGDGYTNIEEFLNGTEPTAGSICTRLFLPLILKSVGSPNLSVVRRDGPGRAQGSRFPRARTVKARLERRKGGPR
jgi:pectate lyase